MLSLITLHSALTVDVEPDANNGSDTGTKATSSATGWFNFHYRLSLITHIVNSNGHAIMVGYTDGCTDSAIFTFCYLLLQDSRSSCSNAAMGLVPLQPSGVREVSSRYYRFSSYFFNNDFMTLA